MQSTSGSTVSEFKQIQLDTLWGVRLVARTSGLRNNWSAFLIISAGSGGPGPLRSGRTVPGIREVRVGDCLDTLKMPRTPC